MPTLTERACASCKSILLTTSKALVCKTCQMSAKQSAAIEKEKSILSELGYVVNEGPEINVHKQRVYSLITPCCSSLFKTTYGNLQTGIKKNAKSGYNKLPCPSCGGKSRASAATQGLINARKE